MIVYDKEQKQIVIPNGLGNVNIIINGGGDCPEPNLGDLVKEITENGNYVYYPSNDGLDGYKMADIRINVPQGGGCTLTTRTIKENGTYRASDGYSIPVINFSQNGAFDSKLKVDVINTYIEFYFAFKDERPDLISFYGCEDSDWQNTTFAARYYSGDINVKIGSFERSFNVNGYGLVDGQVHKMKVGRTYGIEIDGQMAVTSDEIENGIVFTPSETRTIYIGAINSPGIEDNGLNLFWRPFNGYIGPVAIYGKREDGEQVLYNYQPGDYGWWGEYKIVETNQRIENINRQEGATPLDHKTYNPNAVGYSEVTVNVPQYNLGTLDWTLTSPSTEVKNASDDGYDGYSQVTIRPENVISQEKERAINDFKNKMDEITITENGTYSIDDREIRHYIEFDGNSYFDSNVVFIENSKIEVAILKTTYEEDEQIIGTANYDFIADKNYCGFGIVVGAGLAYGVFGKAKTTNIPFSYEEEQILTLDRNGIHSSFGNDTGGWIDNSGLNDSSMYGTTIGIGKVHSYSNGWMYRGLKGRIRYVKIWTNKDDDSTMTLFRPKNMAQGGFGMVNSEGTEYSYVENLGEGTATFVEEWVNKYPYGFKRVEVNVPDLNGSYNEGYNQGKTDGINEQKSKLEAINITENGTYRKEDGYNEVVVNVPDLNGDYNEGYAQGQADVAANARVLNVTKNGNYLSKFSDPILPPTVTGVYADGTDFYNYAELTNKVFNTKIAGSVDSRLEFWYKGDNIGKSDGWDVIIGSGDIDNKDCFQVRYFVYENNTLHIGVGNSTILVDNWDDTVWHHLVVSKAEGLWIDGEKKWDFSPSNTINGEFFINGVGYNADGSRTANGCFGMIKIDNVVIIPTAEGFKNVNTGELLEVVKDGGYTFRENDPIYGEGELYKTINVNVVPQVSIKEAGLNVWYNDLTRITDENDQINSDWDLALQGETIQNVFPGIAMTISGQAVAKPFFIDRINGNSTATRIGKLVSTANGTPVSCAVVIIEAFDCKNIQTVDLEAFKYMTDLCYIDGMNGLGESFTSPQTIDFTYCTNLFIKGNNKKYISNFAESLFNLSAGNKNGINTSTLKFKSAVQERSGNADAIALMQSKGWTVEFV